MLLQRSWIRPAQELHKTGVLLTLIIVIRLILIILIIVITGHSSSFRSEQQQREVSIRPALYLDPQHEDSCLQGEGAIEDTDRRSKGQSGDACPSLKGWTLT